MLLTKDGVHALADFTIRAAPEYDDEWNRVEGNDGVLLACIHPHDGKEWKKQWPGHVAPPSLRDLVLVAQQHWHREHRAEASETTPTEATA